MGEEKRKQKRRLPRTYAIASKEVTVAQFRRFRPSHSVLPFYAATDDCPVLAVTWYDAAEYCNWLSEKEGITADQLCYLPNADGKYAGGMKLAPDYLRRTGYRLPSEAEWEYACRAGAATLFSFGETVELSDRYAWFSGNAGLGSHPVGTLRPNDLGLFDMHGNAWEWAQDSLKRLQPPEGGGPIEDKEDSEDVTDAVERVLRGGSFDDPIVYMRSVHSRGGEPTKRSHFVGFRPARTLP
jgi:formylglycine-generating enzyme required for sulfatase activity